MNAAGEVIGTAKNVAGKVAGAVMDLCSDPLGWFVSQLKSLLDWVMNKAFTWITETIIGYLKDAADAGRAIASAIKKFVEEMGHAFEDVCKAFKHLANLQYLADVLHDLPMIVFKVASAAKHASAAGECLFEGVAVLTSVVPASQEQVKVLISKSCGQQFPLATAKSIPLATAESVGSLSAALSVLSQGEEQGEERQSLMKALFVVGANANGSSTPSEAMFSVTFEGLSSNFIADKDMVSFAERFARDAQQKNLLQTDVVRYPETGLVTVTQRLRPSDPPGEPDRKLRSISFKKLHSPIVWSQDSDPISPYEGLLKEIGWGQCHRPTES